MAEGLSNADVSRYSRQLLVPALGAAGQVRLKHTAVLVIGVGGLGAPVALYLAAAGIGTIGLLDYDSVELSNLHRQIVHTEGRVGVRKAESGKTAVEALNSDVVCHIHNELLSRSNALDIFRGYNIVVDCSDNVATRYLANDACVLLQLPLVSGSALQMEGQLTVYNWRGASGRGPCYRCLHPQPPPKESVTNCSDGGVIGAICGIIGSTQALEVIKIASGKPPLYAGKMLLFDGEEGGFRTIKIRPRSASCVVCGDQPIITELIDYVEFCGASPDDKDRGMVEVVPAELRCTVQVWKTLCYTSNWAQEYAVGRTQEHVLLDCRAQVQYDVCRLPNSLHIPLRDLKTRIQEVETAARREDGTQRPIFSICRRGNDSQTAVQQLAAVNLSARSIDGGLRAWATEVDTTFPFL